MESVLQDLPIRTLYIEVTHACNQNCKHCYLNGGIQNPVAEMTTEQIKKILKEFKKQNGRYVVLTGGEPIVRKDIFNILDYIEELEIPFSFASNSLAMTKHRLEKLSSYTHLDMYFTSVLGANSAMHREVAGKDSYDKVFEALTYLEEKKVPAYVQVTLANAYIDDMETIVQQLMQLKNCTAKITPIGTFGIKPTNEAEKNQHLLVPKEKFEYFHHKVSLLQKKYPGRVENANILDFEQISEIIKEYKDKDLYALCYGFIAVRPNGDISFSCNMENPFVFGKAYESIRIPVDHKLKAYISLLRKAEKATLKEAENAIVEFDVTVDKYINLFSKQPYSDT